MAGPGIRDRFFAVNDAGERRVSGFTFNGWGTKFPPYKDDALLKARLCAHLDVPLYSVDLVLEGGAIALDGDGTILTTARRMLKRPIPTIGINVGKLGFLAEFSEAMKLVSMQKYLRGGGGCLPLPGLKVLLVGIILGTFRKCSRDDLDEDEPPINDGYDGITYAAKAGYFAGVRTIINCSWGGGGFLDSENSVINNAFNTYGAIIVAAAGNGVEDAYQEEYAAHYPASFDNVVFGCELSHFAKCRGLSAINIKAIIL